MEAELPFMGQEAPRPSTRPRWIDADEAMLKLLAIRQAPQPVHLRGCVLQDELAGAALWQESGKAATVTALPQGRSRGDQDNGRSGAPKGEAEEEGASAVERGLAWCDVPRPCRGPGEPPQRPFQQCHCRPGVPLGQQGCHAGSQGGQHTHWSPGKAKSQQGLGSLPSAFGTVVRLLYSSEFLSSHISSTVSQMQVSLASAVVESAEVCTDVHVSRTVSLNSDSAVPAAAQKGNAAKMYQLVSQDLYSHL